MAHAAFFGQEDKAHVYPLSPDAFVLSGSLGEWIFVVEG
jgi:hypothetical protein